MQHHATNAQRERIPPMSYIRSHAHPTVGWLSRAPGGNSGNRSRALACTARCPRPAGWRAAPAQSTRPRISSPRTRPPATFKTQRTPVSGLLQSTSIAVSPPPAYRLLFHRCERLVARQHIAEGPQDARAVCQRLPACFLTSSKSISNPSPLSHRQTPAHPQHAPRQC